MTKRKSTKKYRISPEGLTIVNSKAYGQHERAARGSKSKVEVNDAMKAHSLRMIGSNLPAKLIQDALEPYRKDFKGGMIWQKLVKHFAAQAKAGQDYSVLGINNWDLNKAYPTVNILNPSIKITAIPSESILNIHLNYYFSNRFLQRKSNITAFQVTIIMLFPDFINNKILTVPTVLPEKKLEDLAPYSFIVHIPEEAGTYLACFKAEACNKSGPIISNSNVGKVMCLLKSEKL